MNWNDPEEYNAYRRALYQKNKESDPEQLAKKDASKFARYYNSSKGRAAHMLNNAKSRAKRLGLSCTLSQEWFVQRVECGICEVTGLPFTLETNGGKGHRDNPFSPSVDRIDQTGDYTPENCRMTIWIYNRARGAFPDSSFDVMINAILNNRPLLPSIPSVPVQTHNEL